MSFRSAEGSKYIDDGFSFVSFPVAQGSVEFPQGLTSGDVTIESTGKIIAEEFEVSQTVYLASTGVEAPLGNFGDVVCTNLIEAKNEILLTAGEGGVITFEDGTSQSTAYTPAGNVFSFNLLAGNPVPSGDDDVIVINPSGFGGFTAGKLYFISVSIEAEVDTTGQTLTNYNAYLKYNNVVLTNCQIEGATADKVISIPMSGMFIGVSGQAPQVQLICNTTGGDWNTTASSVYNLVRLN